MREVVLIGVFFISWFLGLFCILPIGLGGNIDEQTGAPANPRIVLKLGISLAVAVIVWGIFYALVLNGVVDI